MERPLLDRYHAVLVANGVAAMTAARWRTITAFTCIGNANTIASGKQTSAGDLVNDFLERLPVAINNQLPFDTLLRCSATVYARTLTTSRKSIVPYNPAHALMRHVRPKIEQKLPYNLMPVVAKPKGQQALTPLQSFAVGGFMDPTTEYLSDYACHLTYRRALPRRRYTR